MCLNYRAASGVFSEGRSAAGCSKSHGAASAGDISESSNPLERQDPHGRASQFSPNVRSVPVPRLMGTAPGNASPAHGSIPPLHTLRTSASPQLLPPTSSWPARPAPHLMSSARLHLGPIYYIHRYIHNNCYTRFGRTGIHGGFRLAPRAAYTVGLDRSTAHVLVTWAFERSPTSLPASSPLNRASNDSTASVSIRK